MMAEDNTQDSPLKTVSLRPSAIIHMHNSIIPTPATIPVMRWKIDILAVSGSL